MWILIDASFKSVYAVLYVVIRRMTWRACRWATHHSVRTASPSAWCAISLSTSSSSTGSHVFWMWVNKNTYSYMYGFVHFCAHTTINMFMFFQKVHMYTHSFNPDLTHTRSHTHARTHAHTHIIESHMQRLTHNWLLLLSGPAGKQAGAFPKLREWAADRQRAQGRSG